MGSSASNELMSKLERQSSHNIRTLSTMCNSIKTLFHWDASFRLLQIDARFDADKEAKVSVYFLLRLETAFLRRELFVVKCW